MNINSIHGFVIITILNVFIGNSFTGIEKVLKRYLNNLSHFELNKLYSFNSLHLYVRILFHSLIGTNHTSKNYYL